MTVVGYDDCRVSNIDVNRQFVSSILRQQEHMIMYIWRIICVQLNYSGYCFFHRREFFLGKKNNYINQYNSCVCPKYIKNIIENYIVKTKQYVKSLIY